MSSWIKLWTEMAHDPKVITLSDEQFRFWINILLLAGSLERSGELGTTGEIALVVRIGEGKAGRLLAALQKMNMVECALGEHKTPSWSIVNFAKRQGKPSDQSAAVRERKQRSRDRKRSIKSHAEKSVTGGRDMGVTERVSRPRHAQEEKRREEKHLKNNTTTTAKPRAASPVDNFPDQRFVLTLCHICSLNPETDEAVDNCLRIDDALEHRFPELTVKQLEKFYSVGGWWHRNRYPELEQPMPPTPRQVLDTIESALQEDPDGH